MFNFKVMANEYEEEYEEGESEYDPREEVENNKKRAQKQSKDSKLKKKAKKRFAAWLVTSGCACCAPLILFFATLSIITICIFYVNNFFNSGNTAAPSPATIASSTNK